MVFDHKCLNLLQAVKKSSARNRYFFITLLLARDALGGYIFTHSSDPLPNVDNLTMRKSQHYFTIHELNIRAEEQYGIPTPIFEQFELANTYALSPDKVLCSFCCYC